MRKEFLPLLLALPIVSVSGNVALCQLCEDGSRPLFPDKRVSLEGTPELDCGTISDLIPQFFDEGTEACDDVHRLSTICGCPRKEDTCDLCPEGSSVTRPNVLLPQFRHVLAENPSCEMIQAYLHSVPKDDELCVLAHQTATGTCGCPESSSNSTRLNDNTTLFNISFPEANATTDSNRPPLINLDDLRDISETGARNDKEVQVQLRVRIASSIMSVVASLFVLIDNLHNRGRLKNLYNLIVTCMAASDTIFSITTAFALIPAPDTDFFGLDGRGTMATCKVQGFFMQFGALTSLFLNASLSTFYVILIVQLSKQSRLQRLRKWLVGLPLVAGLIFACVSIPYIGPTVIGCHIPAPKTFLDPAVLEGRNRSYITWGPFLGLFLIPAYLVIVYCTFVFVRVFWHVRHIDQKSRQWKFSRRRRSSTTSADVTTIKSAADSSTMEPSEALQAAAAAGNSSSNGKKRGAFSSHGRRSRGNSFDASEDFARSPRRARRIRKSNSGRNRNSRNSGMTRTKNNRQLMKNLQLEVFLQSIFYGLALYLSWFTYVVVVVNLEKYFRGHYHLWTFVLFIVPLQGFLNAVVYFRPRIVHRWRKYWKDRREGRNNPDRPFSEPVMSLAEINNKVRQKRRSVLENNAGAADDNNDDNFSGSFDGDSFDDGYSYEDGESYEMMSADFKSALALSPPKPAAVPKYEGFRNEDQDYSSPTEMDGTLPLPYDSINIDCLEGDPLDEMDLDKDSKKSLGVRLDCENSSSPV